MHKQKLFSASNSFLQPSSFIHKPKTETEDLFWCYFNLMLFGCYLLLYRMQGLLFKTINPTFYGWNLMVCGVFYLLKLSECIYVTNCSFLIIFLQKICQMGWHNIVFSLESNKLIKYDMEKKCKSNKMQFYRNCVIVYWIWIIKKLDLI